MIKYKNIKQIHRIYFYIYIIKYIQYKLQTFAYDSLGRRTSLSMPNGTTTSYSYDSLNRLTSLSTLNSVLSTINSFTYTYDNVGNKLSKQDSAGTHNYTYDNTYQLIQSTNPNETFVYDQVGNRTNTTVDAANKLLQDPNATYQYDNNGNRYIKTQTDGSIVYYSYDYEGRLTRVESQKPGLTTVAVYKYDALGRRIEKNVDGVITKYIYDGFNILAEYDENNNVKAQYIQNLGIDDQLAMIKNGQTYYYHKDGLGSITKISDSTGSVVQSYAYDSFGNITSTLNPNFIQPYTFTGREYDPESGLLFLRARELDPKTGTFTQKDPIGFNAGDVNLYRYVGNTPVNYVDPMGLIWVTTGHDYPRKNWFRWWLNRWGVQLGKGLEENMPGADPEEYVGLKRSAIQEWQRDPNNPCRDKDYPLGTRRKIEQTYTKFVNPGSDKVLINDPDADFYYQWSAWVDSPTYKNYPNTTFENLFYWTQGGKTLYWRKGN